MVPSGVQQCAALKPMGTPRPDTTSMESAHDGTGSQQRSAAAAAAAGVSVDACGASERGSVGTKPHNPARTACLPALGIAWQIEPACALAPSAQSSTGPA